MALLLLLTATVTIDNLNQTYDGFPKFVQITTIPPVLVTSTTFNGSPEPPVNVGTYTVVTTVTSPGYSGRAKGTLVISKATPAFNKLSSPAIDFATSSINIGGTIGLGL
jgi:hypothetical protein